MVPAGQLISMTGWLRRSSTRTAVGTSGGPAGGGNGSDTNSPGTLATIGSSAASQLRPTGHDVGVDAIGHCDLGDRRVQLLALSDQQIF
jgi:hypothetical protein